MPSDKPEDEEQVEQCQGDQEELEEDADTLSADAAKGALLNSLVHNPAVLAAVQGKLTNLIGQSSGYIESLPQPVKKRINALKHLQVDVVKTEGKFYQEVHELEMKYAELLKPLHDKRKLIVNGGYEPTEEEGTWIEPTDDEDEEEKKDDEEEKSEVEADKLAQDEVQEKAKIAEDVKGIPEFWLTAMKNVDLISEMIQEHDEPILKHLTDIKLLFSGSDKKESSHGMGFTLEFYFSPNEHFNINVLTKTYKMKSEPDADDPFNFEGPEIVGCSGCKIDWKKGKNITQKIIKKKQKHKGKGQTRVITKTVKNDSFFNFFDPPEVPEEEGEELDEETESLLASDFEIGHFFRERLVPKAVLYFTGEAIDDDEEEEYDETEEGDEEEEDEDEDHDPDYNPPPDGQKPQECKQQ